MAAPGSAKMIACPACGASITLRAIGQSVMIACPSCGSHIDVSRPDIQLIQKYTLVTRNLHIPLGTRGTLRKQTFEVIGALGRSSGAGGRWEEYLLFNPYLGFRWLVYDEGHWNLGQMIKDTSTVHPDVGVPYQGHRFRKFDMDKAVVDWVVGEFYWRVSTGESVLATDYIAPPLMLSCEKSGQEVTWTLLEYIEPAEVEAAFHNHSPARSYLGINQPNTAAQTLRSVRRLALWAIVAAFLVQIVCAALAKSTVIPLGTYNLKHKLSDETQVYGPFSLPRAHSVDEVVASGNIDNAWVELQGTLTNTDTGQSYRFVNAFQYYHGYDSDGSWSEGSRNGGALIPNVPAGTYTLLVDGTSGDNSGRPLDTSIQIGLRYDVVVWRNFWIAVLLILSYPIYLAFRSGVAERERWSDSDYSPTGANSQRVRR
ncbi:MAG TPA: DUF4178 domain-containing protein [Steroidobacteraceae bacterium]|jgi:hypothetical protein|nr:DUF4178 domain-containing protein [Steroidobacteraceae bacterium]